MTPSNDDLDRREALKLIASGLGLAALEACAPAVNAASSPPRADPRPAPEQFFAAPPMTTVRIGFVGVGGQGTAHVQNLLRIEGCVIKAVDDIVPEKVTRIQDLVEQAGFPRPTGYSRGPTDFVRMCEQEELDLVFSATPWEWHVPICLAAMRSGKHTATEVPAAYTVDDCWALVESAEKYGKHCVMMENCNYDNYDRMEMMVFNMVRQGLFGEILHAEGGYLHDLRSVKFSPEGEGLWRRAHSMTRNGNLYPTHGLGPVANCLDINRGDRFASLVSMSGPSRGLQLYAREHFPDGSPQRQEQYVLGDVNVSLIKTANGRTICVSHETNLPRPYSRVHVVQGTHGLFQGYPHRVYIEGRSKEDEWEPAEAYLAEFDHPLWKQMEEKSRGAGHGGMDFLEDYRLIKCLREGLPTDMNVYDAAALSVVTPLSEWSVANGSRPIEFPDFTRGRWKTWPRLGIVTA
jgi:hypothetical protein